MYLLRDAWTRTSDSQGLPYSQQPLSSSLTIERKGGVENRYPFGSLGKHGGRGTLTTHEESTLRMRQKFVLPNQLCSLCGQRTVCVDNPMYGAEDNGRGDVRICGKELLGIGSV
nr:hypothetical protein Iba_chr08cCG1180 [Ipomoea batatas]